LAQVTVRQHSYAGIPNTDPAPVASITQKDFRNSR